MSNSGRFPIFSIEDAYTNIVNFFVAENPFGDEPEVAGFYVVDACSRTIERNDGHLQILDGYATEGEARLEAKVWEHTMMGERVLRFSEDWWGLAAGTPVVFCSMFTNIQGETMFSVRSVDGSESLPNIGGPRNRTNVAAIFLRDLNGECV